MATPRTPDILAGLGQGGDDAVVAAMGPQAERISTVKIRLDGGTQPRAGIDQSVVDDYYADMTSGAVFPPVELIYDGAEYWLWDGFHRFHAWRRDGDRAILAHVRQGTRRDAVLLSVGANATHGFRRTNEDKRRAVMALLDDEEWGQWSDSEIARRCAVSHPFVGKLRAELSCNGYRMETRRVERNGVEYDMKLPERSAAPAVAAQGGKFGTAEELDAAVKSWLVAYETDEERAAALVEVCELGEGSVTFDDLVEWIDVKPRRAADLIQAAGRVLIEVRAQQAPAAATMGALEAVLHRRNQQPLVSWTAEELEEELLELESVSLAGADEDWLFDHMTDIGKRLGRSLTRPVFDMAMRLAIPRQVAALQRQDRLERAQAAAMAVDAERARSAPRQSSEPASQGPGGFAQTGPSGVADPVRADIAEQGEVVRTMDVLTGDGRVLLRLRLGYPGKDVWIELVQHQVSWLRDELAASLETLKAAEARRIEALEVEG